VFLKFGAPTHRLESYLVASAKALCFEASFIAMPTAILCCFGATHVQLVRETQGVDLSRLQEVFDVYKHVLHNDLSATEGVARLQRVERHEDLWSRQFRVFMFGVAAVCVGPFAFGARPVDFAPIFALGYALGVMQLVFAPASDHFSYVFEVFAPLATAFLARGLGTIRVNDHYLFCFSAMSQSSIALILPGYIALTAVLELQSRHLVAGAIRMVYCIIYTLFLGFGLFLGTTIFGVMTQRAVNTTTCEPPQYWPADLATGGAAIIYSRFIWVPLFASCLAIINQATLQQLPVMALISTLGHQTVFWLLQFLTSNLQIANTLGGLVIGLATNVYSRFFDGIAGTAILPAIFVLVPSGLAASGSLMAGVDGSNLILHPTPAGSLGHSANQTTGPNGGIDVIANTEFWFGTTIINVAYGMIQVAIGLSFGLYISALIVWPFAKRKRNDVFSF
jgi:uncharacterized membrane protein YjjP (DUF1212 family)